MANNLFDQLCNGLHRADDARPEVSCVCLGFRKGEETRISCLKNPMVYFYSKKDDAFYVQGPSKQIPKGKFKSINENTARKTTKVDDLVLYIPQTKSIIEESNKPLD